MVNVSFLFSNAHRLSPVEEAREALLSLESRELYRQQSAQTRDNAPAPFPKPTPGHH